MEKETNVIDLRRFWRAVKQLKWLYLAMILAMGSAAVLYVVRSLPKIPIEGEILIGEESFESASGTSALGGKGAGGMGQLMKTFSVGGFSGAAVDNELLVIASHDNMLRTVRAMGLNRTYIGKTAEGEKEMLYRNSPITVAAPEEYFDTLSKADIKATKGFFKKTIASAENVTLPTLLKTPYGNLQIMRTEQFASSPFRTVTVGVCGNNQAAMGLGSQVDIGIATKLSDVIHVKLDYPNAELGKKIVNSIMGQYNAKRLERLHATAESTVKYYDDRIAETLGRLEEAEQKVVQYRKDKEAIAPAEEITYLSGVSQTELMAAIQAQNELNYYNKVKSILKDNLNGTQIIPQVEALGDANIASYNELVIEKRNLEKSAMPGNPTLMKLNERIAMLRDVILENAEKSAIKAQKDINFQRGIAGSAKSRLTKFPAMELDLTVLARNQEFQSSLYQFLLQSRENALLKLSMETEAGFIFQPAYVQKPGLPVKKIILFLGAIIFAIFGVTFLALILMRFSQKVKSPMDVAFLGFDQRTLNLSQDKNSIPIMRTMLMSSPERKIILCASLSEKCTAIESLIESFQDANIPVSILSAKTNSSILSPDFSMEIKEKLESSDYIFIKVPEPERIFELENVIDSDNSSLLLIISEHIKRKSLKNILKRQSSNKIFAFITKD